MSTFTISDKEKAERMLSKAGHIMLDTPVSGTGSQAARQAIWSFYASGNAKADRQELSRCSPPSAAPFTTSAPSAMAAR